MSFQNIMVDIEALGLRAGAAIIDIAAVAFDIKTGQTGTEFHCRVKPVAPFLCDWETIGWHREQQTIIDHPEAIMPSQAVSRFIAWLDEVCPMRRDRVLWSWGSDYDFPLLEPLLDLRAIGEPQPWRFYQTRCARTVWRVAFGELKHAPRPHTALEDVKAAIGDLMMALREIKR